MAKEIEEGKELILAGWQKDLDELRERVAGQGPDPEDGYENMLLPAMPEGAKLRIMQHLDAMVAEMQTPEARTAVDRFFRAHPSEYPEIIEAAKAKGHVAMKQAVQPPEQT